MNWRMPIFPNKSAENEIAGLQCPPEKKLFLIISCTNLFFFLSNFKICNYTPTKFATKFATKICNYNSNFKICNYVALPVATFFCCEILRIYLSILLLQVPWNCIFVNPKQTKFYILLKPGLTSKLKPGTEFPGLLACFLSRRSLFLATTHDSIAFCCGCQIQNRPETLMAR